MMWLAAILAGGAIGAIYCASLWFAVSRAVGLAHPAIWLGFTSLARLGLVGSLFSGLAILGPEIALWALLGFAATRGAVAYWAGGNGHGQ
jgi:F1F0 ATPase subunit 2